MSPFASVSAFLQSIIPTPVFSRSSLTCLALTSICNPFEQRNSRRFRGLHGFNPRDPSNRRLFFTSLQLRWASRHLPRWQRVYVPALALFRGAQHFHRRRRLHHPYG